MSDDLIQPISYMPSFKDNNITEIDVFGFANWMMDSGNVTAQHALRLPAVQRTALWSPERIINLWDSLLRGLPIGMFYLIRPTSGSYSRPISVPNNGPGFTKPSIETGYELLDGQQRALAVLLGRRAPALEGRCLWLDLDRTDVDLMLSLRLTTRGQPFGYNDRGAKLSLDQRRKMRDTFDEGEGKYIAKSTASHDLFDSFIKMDSRPRPPKPFGSVSALPLPELLSAWVQSRKDKKAFRNIVESLLDSPSAPMRQFDILVSAFRNLENGRIGLLLVKNPQSSDTDWLLRLFERIGAGGVALTAAERLYSIYKYHEPFVHDVVAEIEGRIAHHPSV